MAQDEVKAKYPRAKITTVIRKKEDRPEAADHGRSKTRNQRYIDSLRARLRHLLAPAIVDAGVVVPAAEAPRRELAVGDAERAGQRVVPVRERVEDVLAANC